MPTPTKHIPLKVFQTSSGMCFVSGRPSSSRPSTMWKSEGSEFQTKIGQMENWWLQLFENILEFVHICGYRLPALPEIEIKWKQ